MIKSIIYIFTAALVLCSCSSFEMHFKKNASSAPPSLILINNFEVRDTDFDPHISAEFCEALSFEFFRMGYASRIVANRDKNNPATESENIANLCKNFNGDLFITGIISIRESGFLTNRKVNSKIVFQAFSAGGVLLSEGCFMEPNSGNIYLTGKKGAQKFAKKLSKELWGR